MVSRKNRSLFSFFDCGVPFSRNTNFRLLELLVLFFFAIPLPSVSFSLLFVTYPLPLPAPLRVLFPELLLSSLLTCPPKTGNRWHFCKKEILLLLHTPRVVRFSTNWVLVSILLRNSYSVLKNHTNVRLSASHPSASIASNLPLLKSMHRIITTENISVEILI